MELYPVNRRDDQWRQGELAKMTLNRHIRLRPRPVGMPQRDNFDIVLYAHEDQRCLCTAAERVADAMIEAHNGQHTDTRFVTTGFHQD